MIGLPALALPSDPRHGPLPAVLLMLTAVTGVVDALSYLTLGHVFVANMTGNVVFLGFAAGGAKGFSVVASLTATVAFLAGALLGGKITSRFSAHRARHLNAALSVELALVGCALVLAVALPAEQKSYGDDGLLIALGLAMGLQNATARRLGVPDLTTTVLTLTLTGLASDSRLAGGSGGNAGRRMTSVACMFAGAAAGTAIVRRYPVSHALALMLLLLALAYLVTRQAARSTEDWTKGS